VFTVELRGDVESMLAGEMWTARMRLVDQGLRDVFSPLALEDWAKVFADGLQMDC
jgi:hypothetical protein